MSDKSQPASERASHADTDKNWQNISADLSKERHQLSAAGSIGSKATPDAVMATAGSAFLNFEKNYFDSIDENQDYHLSSAELKEFVRNGKADDKSKNVARFLVDHYDFMRQTTTSYCPIHDALDLTWKGISHRDVATTAKGLNPQLPIDPLTKITTTGRLILDGGAMVTLGGAGFVAGPWGAAAGAALGLFSSEVAYMATIGPYQWTKNSVYKSTRARMVPLIDELRSLR